MKKSLVLLLTLIYAFTFCGAVSLAEEERVDVAALAPAASSSALDQNAAENANDGINENEIYTKWVSADDDEMPWWSVDLGLEYKISAIEIEAGIGTSEEERTNFRVIGSNNADFSESVILVNDVLADYGEAFQADVDCDERIRFVKVEKITSGKLSIGEIRIFVNKNDILQGNETEESNANEALPEANRYAVYPDVSGLACEQSVYLLSQIGILNGYTDGTFMPEKEMTRAEFTAVLIRMLGKKPEITESTFKDVPSSHWAYKEISTAAELGLVNGTGNGMFSPNETVTASQVMKMLVCAVGYSNLAEFEGGYPYGYNGVASQLKLYDGVGISNDKINRGQIAIVLDNALDVRTPEYNFDYDSISESFEGETVLNKYLDLRKLEGIVDGVNGTSLFSGNFQLDETYLSINGVEFYSEIPNLKDYLGLSVTFYCTDDDKKAYQEVVAILPSSKNEILMINSEDLDDNNGFDDGYLTYSINEKSKNEPITNKIYVVYNGSALRTPTQADVIPVNGYIKLIDNNHDSVWDVYIVDDIRIGVLNVLDSTSGNIYLKGDKTNPVTFDVYEDIVEVYESETGEKLSLSNLKQGDILSIRESKNSEGAKKITINLSRKIISGALSSKNPNENIVEIDGVEYKCASSFNYNSVSLGDYGDFYVSGENFVANFERRNAKKGLFGYLKKAWIDEDTEAAMFRIFGQDGSWKTYVASDKLRADGVRLNPNGNIKHDDLNNIKTAGEFYQPVRYSVNANGILTEIYTANPAPLSNNDSGLVGPESIAGTQTDESLFWTSTGIIGMKYGTNSDTIMMAVPEDKSSEEDYSVITTASFDTYGYYAIDGYNMGKNNVFDFVIFKGISQLAKASNSIFVVESITEALNSYEEAAYVITGYYDGKQAEYFVEPTAENNAKISKIKEGDILTVRISGNNEIEALNKKFYYNSELSGGETLPADAISDVVTSVGTSATHYYAYGRVKANEDGMMLLELAGTPTSTDLLVNVSGNAFNTYYYNEDNEEIRLGSILDIKDFESVASGRESYVFVHINNREVKDIVIFD